MSGTDVTRLLGTLLDFQGRDVYLVDVASTRNRHAGRLLKSWRLDRGLSPNQLAWEIARSNYGHISGRQIHRIESEGVIPTPRLMFALASFFETTPTAIWRDVVRA